ncbi:MAG TPA: hypothetical protein VIY48_21685 [Candidatus Paceibacterota bacterium]
MQNPNLARQLSQLLKNNAMRLRNLLDPKRILAGAPEPSVETKLTMIIDTLGLQALAVSVVLDEAIALLEPELIESDPKGQVKQ